MTIIEIYNWKRTILGDKKLLGEATREPLQFT